MKNAMTIVCSAVVTSALVAAASSDLRAAVLTEDAFTAYPVNVDITANAGGSGWGGNWNAGNSNGFLRTVRNAGAVIAYPGYDGSSTPAASGGNYLNLASGFGGANPNAVFRSFDLSGAGVYANNGYLSGGFIGADNKTLWGSVLYSNQRVGGASGTATLSFDGPTPNPRFSTGLPQPSTSNLLVLRFDFGAGATDTVTVWSNPNLATFDGTTGGSTSAAGNYQFGTLVLTQQTTAAGGSEFQFDDIRFGTTVSDVVPAAVPEPTTLAALGLLSATILRRRK